MPDLPYPAWKNARQTLHLLFQVIGKVRLMLTPRKNHWWYITLYTTPRGFSTHAIPVDEGLNSLEIELDVKQKAVILYHSARDAARIELKPAPTVAQFYQQLWHYLHSLGLEPHFVEKPIELGIDKNFKTIEEYHHYDWDSIDKFWTIMRWNTAVFEEFSGRFYGKTCPVHIYWHHLDLAVTRFSGKKLPPMDRSARLLERDAYSHEQISFGFWAGDENVPEPMYYSYTYPSPAKVDEETLQPGAAGWQQSNGSPMAMLRYADVRSAADPREEVLAFLESAYRAGASRAGWNLAELAVPSLKDI